MEINLAILINSVLRASYYTEYYINMKRNRTEQSELIKTSEKYYSNWDTVIDMCLLIDADFDRVLSISRAVRKYDQKNGCKDCFPAIDNYDKILEYIQNHHCNGCCRG